MATFTNQATLTYNNTTVNSNIATGEILDLLSATITSVPNDYAPGDALTYVICLVNAGSVPFSGLNLSCSMGGYPQNGDMRFPLEYVEGSLLYYQNGDLQPAPAVVGGPPMTLSNISVPANGCTSLVFAARVTEYAPMGRCACIVNGLRVTGPGLAAPLRESDRICAGEEAALAIFKTISPAAVLENSPVTYTLTLQNYGEAPAGPEDNAMVRDDFDPVLRDVSVTFNGDPWSEGINYTYNRETGLFSTRPGQITVPGASFSQDDDTGVWSVDPGTSVLTITGTI